MLNRLGILNQSLETEEIKDIIFVTHWKCV